jgi:hypothetical protein
MGYGMKYTKGGFPFKQDKQVPLSESEHEKGVMITGGSNSEVINDAEDRIEYITSDAKEKNKGKVRVGPTKDNLQIQKLNNSISKAEQNIKNNNNNTTKIFGN